MTLSEYHTQAAKLYHHMNPQANYYMLSFKRQLDYINIIKKMGNFNV